MSAGNKVSITGKITFAEERKYGKLTIQTYFIQLSETINGKEILFTVKAELFNPTTKQSLVTKDSTVGIDGHLKTNRWHPKGSDGQPNEKEWREETLVIIEDIVIFNF